MQTARTTKFASTKVYDVLVAAPLILFYGFSMAGLRPPFAAAFGVRPVWFSALQIAALTWRLVPGVY